MLYIVASYHCMRFQTKLTNQTWENDKKPSLGPDFVPFGPNLNPKYFFSWIFSGPIFFFAQIRAAIFFFSIIWLCQSLDVMVSYHHVQYQKKLMTQTWWENLVTVGQMDKRDFKGHCPTNVERPKLHFNIRNNNSKEMFLFSSHSPFGIAK